MELPDLRKERAIPKTAITKTANLLASDRAAHINVRELQSRLDYVAQNLNRYNCVQSRIEQLKEATDEDLEDRFEFEEKVVVLRAQIQSLIDQVSKPVPTPVRSEVVPTAEWKLPPMEPPHFSGEHQDWWEFKERMLAMVERCPHDIYKMDLLIKAVKGGKAEKSLTDLSSMDVTWSSAWKALLDRYDNKVLLVEHHLNAIFNAPSVETNNPSELRALVDVFRRHSRILNKLEQPIEQWSTILLYMLERRVDPSTKRAWREKMGITKIHTFADFVNFLLERCNILDSLTVNEKIGDFNPESKHTTVNAAIMKHDAVCSICGSSHPLYRCEKFNKMTLEERQRVITDSKLCRNCLSDQHFVRYCPSRNSCRTCHSRHHSMLCQRVFDTTEQVTTSTSLNSAIAKFTNVILATAVINIKDSKGRFHVARAFLDPGSQACHMTLKFANQLGLRKMPIDVPVSGLGGSQIQRAKSQVEADICSNYSDFQTSAAFLVIEKILDKLPTKAFPFQMDLLQGIELADPYFNQPGRVDVLINASVYYKIIKSRKINLGQNMPTLQETEFGFIVSGDMPTMDQTTTCYTNAATVEEQTENLDRILQNFFDAEDLKLDNNEKSDEERFCENYFDQTCTLENGRFKVKLPFKHDPPHLGQSRGKVIRSFRFWERKLMSQPDVKQMYSNFIQEMMKLGHLEPVQASDDDKCNYISHHPVIRLESQTTKVRPVVNASMKTSNGRSLNDELYVGPILQDDMANILLRFRMNRIALVGDIAMMYRCIDLDEADRDFQRIVWRANQFEPIRDYRITTVIYGTASAPFLATKCLQRAAISGKEKYPIAYHHIMDNFYVDDLVSGGDSVEEVIQVRYEIQECLSQHGFFMRKWSSNDVAVTQAIKESRDTTELLVNEDDEAKVLGLKWCKMNDSLSLSSVSCSGLTTKRSVLSDISKAYDPLGLASPVLITAKLLMQLLWKSALDWDDDLPQDILQQWLHYRSNLELLHLVKVPRKVIPVTNPKSCKLAVFSDASSKAFAACVYLLTELEDGTVTVEFLCSKTRVAPLKNPQSIPRLELNAALLAARLIGKVKIALRVPDGPVLAFCDSKVVLAWIQTDPDRLKCYVGNRVKKLGEIIGSESWQYVKSAENPADIATRGATVEKLAKCALWWNGPAWLRNNIWSASSFSLTAEELDQVREEFESPTLTTMVQSIKENHPVIQILNYCGTYSRMLRFVAWWRRTIFPVKSAESGNTTKLTNQELEEALFLVVKVVQAESYSKEIHQLETKGKVSRRSPILSLNPILDERNILRVGGRLNNASKLSYDFKRPIILPSKNRFAQLLMEHEHRRNLHCGGQQLLATVRQKFWPVRGLTLAKKVVRSCTVCFKAQPRLCGQLMGDLPSDRIDRHPAFDVVGVDFAGPFRCCARRGKGQPTLKAWTAVFRCMVTGSIHLEYVSELTKEAFLAALQRFVSRRGLPSKIWSDNGTNFIGAKNDLEDLKLFLSSSEFEAETTAFFTPLGVEWKTIPPNCPHMGGIWEASVRLMKRHLKRVMGDHRLTLEEFSTLLCRIEGALNSRPITPNPDDPRDDVALTPGHILIGRALNALPERPLTQLKLSYLRHWRLVQRLAQDFWHGWKCDLVRYNQRNRWKTKQPQLKPGDVVMIADDNLPTQQWKLATVQSLQPGPDGLVRVVQLRIPGCSQGKTILPPRFVQRSVHRLAKLPICESSGGEDVNDTTDVDLPKSQNVDVSTAAPSVGSVETVGEGMSHSILTTK